MSFVHGRSPASIACPHGWMVLSEDLSCGNSCLPSRDGSVLVVESCELIFNILIKLATKARTEDVCQDNHLLVGDRKFSGGTRDECFYATGMDIGVVFGVSSIRLREGLYNCFWFVLSCRICLFRMTLFRHASNDVTIYPLGAFHRRRRYACIELVALVRI